MVPILLHQNICNNSYKLRPVLNPGIVRREFGVIRKFRITQNFLSQCPKLPFTKNNKNKKELNGACQI